MGRTGRKHRGPGEGAKVRLIALSGPHRIEVVGFGNGHTHTHEFIAWGSDARYERCRTCGEARRTDERNAS